MTYNDITLQKIFEEYWNQTLLLLTFFGISLKMIFTFYLKKREVSHGIVYQNRMEAVIRFFNAFAEVKSMWQKLPIFKILNKELNPDEVDKQVQPPLNRLEASILELQIYFDGEMFAKFELIGKNMRRINGRFLEITFNSKKEYNVVHRANDYEFHRQEIDSKNSFLIKEICKNL
ncbi:hypothetical protein FUAX_51070 (plasmid) [Fulvitalea axinellae]|uniref:Uncharacterized protein n=1 Tax=Fulvitalea axinellae TaxID=1182444 RepID=A0AAU9DJJ0_9BACT|nr:hypothetical protein FUAX_51070 [Fulvitalea axinellae]